MKSKILSIIVFTSLMFSVCACAEFFPDIIITSPNGIWTDSRAYSTLQDAIDAVGVDDREIVIVNEQSVTNLTIPSNVRLKFLRDGSINNSGQLTINTRNISADDRQIFTGSGDIDFVSGSIVRSSWFLDLVEVLNITTDDSLTLIISESDTLDSNCTVGDDVSLMWESNNNVISANSGCTLSNIKDINAGEFQLFAGAGDFDFLSGTKLKSSWFIRLRNLVNYVEADQVDVEIAKNEVVNLNTTSDENTTFRILQGGMISPDAGVLFTINGCLDAGFYRIFSGGGSIQLNTDIIKVIYPQWTGSIGLPRLVSDPTVDTEMATKKYVDDNSGGGGSGDGNVTGPASSINNAIVLFDGISGTKIKDSTRIIEDSVAGGSNIPDSEAIVTYGNTHWQTGSGDVLGPPTNTIFHVPQWDGTPNSKTLIDGFDISDQGKGLVDDLTAANQRSTLGLGSAATRDAADVMDGVGGELPSESAIKTYGDANWQTGSGDVLGPATHTIYYVPQWNGVPDSKTLIEGFDISDQGKDLVDDLTASNQRSTLGLGTAATRTASDVMNGVGSELPDEAAIKAYGDSHWSGGSGDVIGPPTNTIYHVPQWNGTPDSKTLINGFDISDQGKDLVDDVTASAQRSTLGLGSAAIRNAEDSMTNGSNLPDGGAVISYGNAHWASGSSETFTVVAMGQSNMVGFSGTGGDKATDARVTAWNGAAWVTADLYQLPFTLGSTPGNNNIAFHFAKQLAEERGCNVKIILEAENGRPISDWVPATATHYAGMRNQITDSGTTKVDFVLWHQGESDYTRSYAAYGADLNTLCNQLRAEPQISITVPILMNELIAGGPLSYQNYVFERITDYVSDPFVNVAKAKFLPNVGDLVHLTGGALVSSGRMRFHTALRTITGMAAGHKGSANVIEINDCADKINNENLEVYDDLVIIAGGNARVKRHANQTIPHSTWTIIQLNSEDWDLGNNFASYRFTSTADGYYLVIAQCMYDTLSADSALTMVGIFRNNVRTGIETNTYGVTGTYTNLQASGIFYLGVGDYVDARTFQYSGYNQTLVATGTGETKQWIMVKRVL